ncbi:MAG: hypothetical protein R3247_13375 [Rhodothermales bacterium]|nr:hypothetical protein [Rhodothermales bacterium]
MKQARSLRDCGDRALAVRPSVFAVRQVILLCFLAAPAAMAQPTPAALRAALLAPPAQTHRAGPPEDRWWARDKLQHVTFSFLWTVGSQYTLVEKIGVGERRALPLAMGSAAAVGLAKEVYDARTPPHRHFSRRDLAADALGIALAAGLILL